MLVKRRDPSDIYRGVPCSVVAVGTAKGATAGAWDWLVFPEKLRDDGYLSLAEMDRFIRRYLPVRRREYYRRGERPTLLEYLRTSAHRAVICVRGHYLYADRNTYYSFLKNGRDEVISVWILE